MAELASVARLRERLTIAHLLNEASDRLYDEGRASALAMAAHGTRPRIERTQVLRLGAIVEQTGSVSSLLDHIQNQTGKRPEWRQDDFGHRFLVALTDLRPLAESLAVEARTGGSEQNDLERWFHLELCRRFVHHFIAAYVAGPPASMSQARSSEPFRTGTAPRGAQPDRRVAAPVQPRKPIGGRQGRSEQPPPNQDRRTVAVVDNESPPAGDALTIAAPTTSPEHAAALVDGERSTASPPKDEAISHDSPDSAPASVTTTADDAPAASPGSRDVEAAEREPRGTVESHDPVTIEEPKRVEEPKANDSIAEAPHEPEAGASPPAPVVSESTAARESNGAIEEEHGVGRNN